MAHSHKIRRQTLELLAASEETALALQPRLPDINRRFLLPVIDRVLTEFDVQDMHIRIDQLQIDLGALPLQGFEQEAEQALERELRAALEEKVSAAVGYRPMTVAKSRLELFNYYLSFGVLPFWAPDRKTFSFPALFAEVLKSNPTGLIRSLRASRGYENRLLRLILQLGKGQFGLLLQQLEARHADLILAYLLDLEDVHQRRRLIDVSAPVIRQTLRLLTLVYLLRDPGTQFNRKSFVWSLLTAMARRYRVDLLDLLQVCHQELLVMGKSQHLSSSLPSVLHELIQEHSQQTDNVSEPADDQQLQAIRDWLELFLTQRRSIQELKQQLPSGWVMADVVRQIKGDRNDFRSLIAQIAGYGTGGSDLLVERLREILPDAEIVTLMAPDHVQVLNRIAQSISAEIKSDSTAWQVLLSALVREQGTDSLEAGRLAIHIQQQLESLSGTSKRTSEMIASEVRSVLPSTTGTSALEERATPPEGEVPATVGIFSRYDELSLITAIASQDTLPWRTILSQPGVDEQRVLQKLISLPKSMFYRLIGSLDTDSRKRLLWKVAGLLDQNTLIAFVLRLMPTASQHRTALVESVSAFAAAASDSQTFFASLLDQVLERQQIDLEALQSIESDLLPAQQPEAGVQTLLADAAAELAAGTNQSKLESVHERLMEQPEMAVEFYVEAVLKPHCRRTLTERMTERQRDEVFTLLYDDRAVLVSGLLEFFNQLPVSVRPMWDRVLAVVLKSGLGVTAGVRGLTDFVTTVVNGLFGRAVPPSVLQGLAHEMSRWQHSGVISSRDAGVLQQSLDQIAGVDGVSEKAPMQPGSEAEQDQLGEQQAMLQSALWMLTPEQERHQEAKTMAHPGRFDLDQMISQSPELLKAFVQRHAAEEKYREHWIKHLPESSLVRVCFLLQPSRQRILMDAAELMVSGLAEILPHGRRSLIDRQHFWKFLLGFFSTSPQNQRSLDHLVRAFFDDFGRRYRKTSSQPQDARQVGASLVSQVSRLARKTGNTNLLQILNRHADALTDIWWAGLKAESSSLSDQHQSKKRKQRKKQTSDPQKSLGPEPELETIYVDNAGLVLCSPFLPHLFKTIGGLDKNDDGKSVWADEAQASRAVHLLQFLADGIGQANESELALNRVLCGLSLETPVEPEWALADTDRQLSEQLLNAMIGQWAIIENTSIAGLRETFLLREGALALNEEQFRLTVQRKTVDILVDQVPWGFSVIMHPWMSIPLHVDWAS